MIIGIQEHMTKDFLQQLCSWPLFMLDTQENMILIPPKINDSCCFTS